MVTPKLSRAAFELIAATIRDLPLNETDHESTAAQFADALTPTCAGFNRARFLKACEANN